MAYHYSPVQALCRRTFDQVVKAKADLVEAIAAGDMSPYDLTLPLPYRDWESAYYEPFKALTETLSVGDTIELPSGMTLRVVFKPRAGGPK